MRKISIDPMATHSKIADSEMNYFQFKARQMLLLKKEDREWQEFCKQTAPECTACTAEKVNLKESKDIGIQANSRTPLKKLERTPVYPRRQNEQIPEALNNIRARLENIDLALSKIYNASDESEKKYEEATAFKNAEAAKLFKEERRHFIQNSLKTSLEKLQSHSLKATKKPTPKLKSSSFFLPHDLQVKRAASRKAYLASLKTKPKVSFQTDRLMSKKTVQSFQNKKDVLKHSPKSRKKVITKKLIKPPNVETDTLIASIEIDEGKDENIEFVVDAILEDLLGEAGLDINRIKVRKRELNAFKQKTLLNKEKVTDVPLTSTMIKNTNLEALACGDNSSIKLFSNSSTKLHSEKNKQTELLSNGMEKKTSILHPEYLKHVPEETSGHKRDNHNFQLKQFSKIKDPPKFVCDVLHLVTINHQKAKDIIQNKERYWRYLKNISRIVKGNFNPWVLNSMLAESILDDCIKDIAEELSDVPSTFVQDLYNQEFIQQVEK